MKHIDAVSHTRGESQYVDDMPQPSEMLYAAVFSSPVMHGKIKALHIQDAYTVDGIVTVLTAKDIPGQNIIHRKKLLKRSPTIAILLKT